MTIWILMMIITLIIPFLMIGLGICFIKYTPKDINQFIGYRTSMSMKNNDTWEFSHRHCGKSWIKIGILLLIFSPVVMLFSIDKNTNYIANFGVLICVIQFILLISSIIPTEMALRRNFDKDGIRKN